ncbi:MAG: endolytic transglycosylase MltG [Clostridia bacterium]|nr:endolytic transglycosylase MltG [Clostridia bacterium]
MLKTIKNSLCIILSLLVLAVCCACSMGRVENAGTSAKQNDTGSNIVRVTFPEGFTVSQIAQRLEENGVCSAAEFTGAVNDTENLEKYGIEIDSPSERAFLLEGYLFPDTYDFYIGEKVSSVIRKFVVNFNSQITEEMRTRAAELGYSLDEIIAIASIIQEEADVLSEMPRVSAVLHNRLASPEFPKLQCDACTFYLRDSVRPYISESDYERYLQTYSTYNCTGLPEGPITNPGIEAVKAALYPSDDNYYFFVTDANNTYYYAETYSEHLENCKIAGIQ